MLKKSSYGGMPQVVNDCRELLLWMIPHLDKLPKNRRYTLGGKAGKSAADLAGDIGGGSVCREQAESAGAGQP